MAKYKLSLFIALFSFLSSFGQLTPMTAFQYGFKRIVVDSTLQIPSFCGVPTLRNSTVKNGALAMDTCNNKLYKYTRAAGWSEVSGGGGSQDLQSVTDEGNTTNNQMIIGDGTDSLILAKDAITLFSGTFGGYGSVISALVNSWTYSSNSTSLAPILNGQHNFYLYNSNTSTLTIDTLATLANVRASGSAIDTTSLSNRINLKVNISDTASMLSKYLRKIDTSSLSNRINLKVNISDTASMLLTYLRKIDTTNKWVNSVTKLNDSTIRVIKGSTTTDITLTPSATVTSATRLVTTVYNNSGSTITKGSVVYINGRHSSNLPTIALAQANTEANSYATFALVESDITNGSSGIVIQAGNIGNLNLPTSSYTDGQVVFLSPTTAGGITTTKPLAPYHIVKIGTITRAHPTFGTIELKIENGWQLDELSDVQIPLVPNDSTLLQFSRVDSLWHSVSVTNAIGSNYIKPSDTTSLSSRINLKLNISDTASMLSKYSRKDTSCFHLTSDVSTSNTTATNTNLTFPIAANETYRIMIAGTCSKASTTTGMKIAIAAPTGCSIKSVIQGGQALMVTAPQGQLYSSVNTLCTNVFATGAGVEVPFRLEGVITNGANAGSITLQFATVTSNTATIYAGTVMQLIKSKGL